MSKSVKIFKKIYKIRFFLFIIIKNYDRIHFVYTEMFYRPITRGGINMQVAIMGFGTIGSGVAEVISNNHDSIAKKSSQAELEVKYILDLRDFPGDVNENKMIKELVKYLNDSYDHLDRTSKVGDPLILSPTAHLF